VRLWHTHTYTHTNTRKIADDVNPLLEVVFSKLLNITKNSGKVRNDLKHDIVDSVSNVRRIFANLRNSLDEQTTKIKQLLGELNKAKAERMESRVAKLPGRTHPSRGGIGQPTSAPQYQLPPSGGPKTFYSKAVSASAEKRYKLTVKSKLDLSTKEVKTSLGQM
jgi:hypothetical protein